MNRLMKHSSAFPWHDTEGMLLRLIVEQGARVIGDIGGGKRPLVRPERVKELGIRYVVLDIDQTELDLADPRYEKVCVDMTGENVANRVPMKFDFMFSMYFLEHVKDPLTLHRNIYSMLAPGGRVLHFFPTLFALPFVVNKLTSEGLGDRLLNLVQPERKLGPGKARFPAYYRWCFGPSRSQVARFESLGYEVERYVGYCGHNYYARIPALAALESMLAHVSARMRLTWRSAFAEVQLARPDGGENMV